LSIKEIGCLAGFNSTRAFDRFVKRHSGCRPTELRPENVTRSADGPAVHPFDKRSP
jgi:AraC-like DNA-binding protein